MKKEEKRVFLRNEQQIELARQQGGRNHETYTVGDLIGQGHSAVCYEAVRNSDGMTGKLKEFYPLELAQDYGKKLRRLPDGQLVTEQDVDGQFDKLCEDYLENYKRLIRVMRENPQNEILKNFIQIGDILYGCFPDGTTTVYIWSAGIQGQNYQKRLAEIHQKPEEESARKIYEILQTVWTLTDCVRSLHMAGLMHLDIKPGNFLVPLRSDRTVNPGSISMFDIDTLYSVGQDIPRMLGTSGYRAPELAKGKADNRSDIYSIGAMLFVAIMDREENMFSGRKYRDEDYEDLGRRVRKSRLVTGSGLDETGVSGLTLLLKKCLAEEPEERYGSCTSLLVDLGLVRDRVSRHVTIRSLSEVSKRNLWDGAYCWLENVRKEGHRFSWLKIDRNIMPYAERTTTDSDILPVHVYDNSQQDGPRIPLMEAISNTQENIFLIGEGGIGKTTALMSIMENAYKTKTYTPGCQVPLFVELSYAPDTYGAVYENGRSSFIRRSVYRLLCVNSRVNQRDSRLADETYDVYNADAKTAVDPVNVLFTTKPSDGRPEYLLLLDGLNEVSRSIVKDNSGRTLHTAASMIISEIQELLTECPNVRVILTSRADEGSLGIEESLTRFYLSGIDDAEISEYLRRNGVDEAGLAAAEANEKLMDILQIPLFLTMYASVHTRENLCTRGDILRIFFNEKSSRIRTYTLQNRLTSVEENRKSTGNFAFNTSISARAQWFILDILLPEIAWNLVKNDNYFLSLEEIRQIIVPVLNGNSDTDICGRYGCRLFTKFSSSSDISTHIKQAAGELLALDNGEHNGEQTAEAIINCCLYSLGIMQENRGLFGFVHQHIRDYLASVKIINTMRMAVFLDEEKSPNSFACLTDFNSAPLDSEIRTYIGEILQEYKNKPVLQDEKWRSTVPSEPCDQNLLSRTLDLYRGRFREERIGYGVFNLLMTMNAARKSLAGTNLTRLDFKNCNLNGIKLFDTDISGSLIRKEILFRNGHTEAVTSVVSTPDEKYIISSSMDGTIKKWDANTYAFVGTIKNYSLPVTHVSLSPDGKYLAVSYGSRDVLEPDNTVEVFKINQFHEYKKLVIKSKKAYSPVFSPDGRYFLMVKLAQGFELKVFDTQTFRIIGATITSYIPRRITLYNSEVAYVKDINVGLEIKIWDFIKDTSYELICPIDKEHEYFISTMDYSPSGRYLAVGINHRIIIWDLKAKKNTVLNIEYQKKSVYIKITALKYVMNGQMLLAACSESCDIRAFRNNNDLNYEYYGMLQENLADVVSLHYKKNRIISGHNDGSINFWNLKTMNNQGFINGNSNFVRKAIYHPSGEYAILLGDYYSNIQIWNTESGKCERELENDSALLDCDIAWPNGDVIAVASSESIDLYDYISSKCFHTIKDDFGYLREIKFDFTGKYLLTNKEKNDYSKVTIFSENKKWQQIFQRDGHYQMQTTFHPQIPSVLINYGIIEGIHEDDKLKLFEEGYSSAEIHLSNDQIIQLFDIESGYTQYIAPSPGHHDFICYSHNADYIATGGRDEIYLYSLTFSNNRCFVAMLDNTRGNSLVMEGQRLKKNGVSSLLHYFKKYFMIKNFAFSYDDRMMVVVSEKGNLNIWDIKSFKEIPVNRKVKGLFKNVKNIQFSPDDRYLLTTDGYDGTARIWDAKTMTLKKTLRYAPGLRVQGADLRNLHPDSGLSEEDRNILKMYGAQTE